MVLNFIFGKKGAKEGGEPKNNPELQKLRNQFNDLKGQGNPQNPQQQGGTLQGQNQQLPQTDPNQNQANSSGIMQNQGQNAAQGQQGNTLQQAQGGMGNNQGQPGQQAASGQQAGIQTQQQTGQQQQNMQQTNNQLNQLANATKSNSGKSKGEKVPVDDYIDPVKLEENERVTNLIMQQIKELIEIDNNLNNKIKDIENRLNDNTDTMNSTKETVDGYSGRLNMIEKNMEKFMGLYEVITNKFNPFVSEEEGDTIFNADEAKGGIKDPEVADSVEESDDPIIDEKKSEDAITEKKDKNVPGGADASVGGGDTGLENIEIPDDKLNALVHKIAPQLGEQLKASVLSNLNQQLNMVIASSMKESTDKLRAEMVKMIDEKTGRNAAEAKTGIKEQEVHPNYHFNLPDGTPIKSIAHLISGLKKMNDTTFSKYVNAQKNDFAQWVRVSTRNNELADKMQQATNRGDMINLLDTI